MGIYQVRELVLESFEEDVVGGVAGEATGGVAGDMKREGFSHEEVLIWFSTTCKPLRNYLGSYQLLGCCPHQRLSGGEAGERPSDCCNRHHFHHGHLGSLHSFAASTHSGNLNN